MVIQPPALHLTAMVDAAISGYEDEYRSHISAAELKVEQAENADREDDRRNATASADRAIEAAKDVVQLMELEGRSLKPPARTDLQGRVRTFRSSIGDLKLRIKEARTPQRPNGDRIREELFAGHSPGPGREEQQRMLAAEDQIGRQTSRLRDVNKTVHDMEEAGVNVLNELHSQRESILRTKSTLAHASEGLETSRRLVRSMARRAAANKLVLYVVIGLIGCVVLLVLYWQVFPADAASAPTAASQTGGGGEEWKIVAKP